MRHLPSICALLGAFTACAEPEVMRAQLGESCGVTGPVRLLELEMDQALIFPTRRIGERVFHTIARPVAPGGEAPYVVTDDVQHWTTGPCGEDPTRLYASPEGVFAIDHWPGTAFLCDGSDIHSLAPEGPPALHPVFLGTGCRPTVTAHGVVDSVPPGALRLHRYPDDPRRDTATPTVLLEGVAARAGQPEIAVAGDDLLARTVERELVRVDLRDGAVTLEQTGIDRFTASPSGRWILSNVDVPGEPGEPPTRAIAVLLDRETGVGVTLAEVNAGVTGVMTYADQGFIVLTAFAGGERIYPLPDLAPVTVPRFYALARDRFSWPHPPLPDGRWIVQSYRDWSLASLDPVTGELAPMFGEPAQVLASEPEGTLVLTVPPCCELARADDEGAVWLVPHDGAAPRELAARSTLFAWRPRPDLLVSPIDIARDRRGALALVDTTTQTQQVIDDRVFAIFFADATDRALVRYSVQDGARSGVWQVRLPP